MGRLVLVGVAVPVGSVRPPRLGLVDRTALDPDALREVVGHEARLRRRGRVGRRRPGDGHVARWARGPLRAHAVGRRLVGRDVPRRGRRRAVGGPDLPSGPARTTRRRRSTRPCSAWCAGWCRCPRSSRYDAGSPPWTSPGLLVTSYLAGDRGDLLLPTLGDARLAALGGHLGALAADLARHADAAPGTVRRPGAARSAPSASPTDCPGSSTTTPPTSWPTGGSAARSKPSSPSHERAQDLLDARAAGPVWCTPTSTPRTSWSTRTPSRSPGVLDWEFAHAGHPFTDLGNLLRFDRHPAYSGAVVCRRGASASAALPRRRSTWPARPTCGPWWTWLGGADRTRWRIVPTSTCRPSLGQEICTRCRSERNAPTWR